MPGPFARTGSTTKQSQPSPGVTVTETTPGGYSLVNNAPAWVLVWSLILVAISITPSNDEANIWLIFVKKAKPNVNALGVDAELVLGGLMTAALTLIASLSEDGAALAIMFLVAVSLLLLYTRLDQWTHWLSVLTSRAQTIQKQAPTKKAA